MGRTLEEVMDAMPADERAAVEARTQELLAEVEGLKALRILAKRSQEQIAQGLGIKQPSVLKIERQTDQAIPPSRYARQRQTFDNANPRSRQRRVSGQVLTGQTIGAGCVCAE